MASLVKTAMVKIVADDGDTQEKLDRIAAKAEELGRLNPDIKVKIDAAAASAEMAVLREELKRTGKDAQAAGDQAATSRGLWAKLAEVFGFSGGGGGGAGTGVAGAAADAGGGISAMAAVLPVAAAGAAVALAALTPFIAGLATAALGVAGFAAIAVPEFTKVWTAVSTGGKALKALDPQERALAKPIESLRDSFGQLEKAVQPEILTAFAEGLKIIKDLMPAIRPLIEAAGHALDTFLKNIDNWLKSPSGQKFIHWLSVEGPQAMRIFGTALWDTAKVIGRVFDFLYNTGETFDQHWRVFWHAMAQIVDGFRIGFTQLVDLLQAKWSAFEAFIESHGQQIIAWFEALPGKLLATLTGLPAQMFSLGLSIIDGLLHGIESAAGGLLSEIGHLASDVSGAFSKVLGIFSPSRVFEQHGRDIVAGLVQGMDSGHGQVTAAATRMAAATLSGATGGHAGATAAGVLQLQVTGSSAASGLDHLFMTWLKNQVRISGGDPRIFTQKVSALV